MPYFEWNYKKNQLLKQQRGITFEEIVAALNSNGLIAKIEHPNKKKYPNQKILIINIENYAYLVPCNETEEKIFLKTIIPSRKATKKYLLG